MSDGGKVKALNILLGHAWMVSSMPLILCHQLGKVYAQFLTKCRETKIGHRLNPAIEADASGQKR